MVGPFSSVNVTQSDNSGMEQALSAVTETVSQMAQMMEAMQQQMQQMQQVNQAMMQKLDGKLETASGHGEAATADAQAETRAIGDIEYTVDGQGNAIFNPEQLDKLIKKLELATSTQTPDAAAQPGTPGDVASTPKTGNPAEGPAPITGPPAGVVA
jgi:hypothetical protein